MELDPEFLWYEFFEVLSMSLHKFNLYKLEESTKKKENNLYIDFIVFQL